MKSWNKMFGLALFILICLVLLYICINPVEPKYIVIERDYGGTILLDTESGTRYLKTGNVMYEIDNDFYNDSRQKCVDGGGIGKR